MDKRAVFLMCQNIKKQGIDIDQMVLDDVLEAVKYLHKEYKAAKTRSRS
jgi:hypothetical protein